MRGGQLRIYLGAAPGVGKTYAMLNEGRRHRDRGTDVVIGFVETHGRRLTAEQTADLEVVPHRTISYRGTELEEMDVDAILARHPDVALIDEIAHTNVPGSRNEKRWQDVHELLEAGINVVSTLNIQHLESLNDVVESITGIQQRETIPDEIVRRADQVELVDMTPEAIRRRMAHGNVYPVSDVDAALNNYFRPGNLGALRELALLWVADRVDEALLRYREEQGIERSWETRERVVVALTGSPSGAQLIRRAARMAERSRAELLGVHLRPSDGRADSPTELLEDHRKLLEDLGGEYHEVVAVDVVDALVRFARSENATQLVLGATRRTRWAELTRGSIINRVLRQAGDIDVHVISTRPEGVADASVRDHRPRKLQPLSPRRRLAGWIVAVAGTGLLTLAMAATRDALGQGSHFLLYQAVVIVAALVGGAAPAVTAALLSSAALNWYFTPPFYTWTVEDAENALALVVFVIVGVLVGLLVTTLARRSADARGAQAEAETLARLAGGLLGAEDPIPPMLERIRTTLGLEGLALLPEGEPHPLAVSGTMPDLVHDPTVPLPEGSLVTRGALTGDDQRVLAAFATQLAAALDRRRLHREAERAAALAEADSLRTALLRGVSHDLRTPLSSIKASVTSLLQGDVKWSDLEQKEFLATIDEEVDRLDTVIANLLDASRLEAGAITPATQAVALDDVVPAALASISGLQSRIELDISPTLPLALADAGLLERALANLIANADRVTPAGEAVKVTASQLGEQVQLRIADRGPGVPEEEREPMFQPFQRLGDTAAGAGVGLGLSVAKGIIEAMGGIVTADETPGGGLTMIVSMRSTDDGR